MAEIPDMPTLERELANLRRKVRNLQVMQMQPNQPAERLKLLADLERAAREEVRLRFKALNYTKGLR